MATLPSLFLIQFFDNAGNPAAGYLLDTFDSGTTTPKATYSNEAGSIANTNPIVLDSAGRCTLFLGSGQYTLRLRTPLGATLWTRDDVEGLPVASATAYLPLAGGTLTGLLSLSGNASANLHAVPLQQVNSLIATSAAGQASSLGNQTPVGSVAMWLTGTPPANWLHCNGAAVSRTTYASLFALLGTTFGAGDGSSTFNLPELRGEFPRFWDATRGIDSGRAIGSAQGDQVKTHTHGVSLGKAQADGNAPAAGGGLAQFAATFPQSVTSDSGGSTTGAENRPRNVALMAIIKAL